MGHHSLRRPFAQQFMPAAPALSCRRVAVKFRKSSCSHRALQRVTCACCGVFVERWYFALSRHANWRVRSTARFVCTGGLHCAGMRDDTASQLQGRHSTTYELRPTGREHKLLESFELFEAP